MFYLYKAHTHPDIHSFYVGDSRQSAVHSHCLLCSYNKIFFTWDNTEQRKVCDAKERMKGMRSSPLAISCVGAYQFFKPSFRSPRQEKYWLVNLRVLVQVKVCASKAHKPVIMRVAKDQSWSGLNQIKVHWQRTEAKTKAKIFFDGCHFFLWSFSLSLQLLHLINSSRWVLRKYSLLFTSISGKDQRKIRFLIHFYAV